MKTVITEITNNRVSIKYENLLSGEIESREFFAPSSGGYVRSVASGSQVCDGLASRGDTLLWSGESPLVNLIRREYQAMRRAEKAELKRAGF